MKKIYVLIILTVLTFSFANGQFTKVGGGLGFTSGFPFHQMTWDYNKSAKFDGFIKGIYELSLPFHISPSFTSFFPHVWKSGSVNNSSKITVNAMMFDVNGQYVFNSLRRFEFYALAGIDILLARKKDTYTVTGTAPFTETIKERDNAIGLNLGAGTYMKMTEQLDLFLEAKYIVSKYDQFMLNAGILINLDWLKKNENPGI
jgi:opacity protein-like surface antigen